MSIGIKSDCKNAVPQKVADYCTYKRFAASSSWFEPKGDYGYYGNRRVEARIHSPSHSPTRVIPVSLSSVKWFSCFMLYSLSLTLFIHISLSLPFLLSSLFNIDIFKNSNLTWIFPFSCLIRKIRKIRKLPKWIFEKVWKKSYHQYKRTWDQNGTFFLLRESEIQEWFLCHCVYKKVYRNSEREKMWQGIKEEERDERERGKKREIRPLDCTPETNPQTLLLIIIGIGFQLKEKEPFRTHHMDFFYIEN